MIANQKTGIPLRGEKRDRILEQIQNMQQEDADWKDGKVWCLVYYINQEHDELLKAANDELYSANYLNPLAFKSLHRMEQEVVHMTADMLYGDENTVGVMTTGGTESILLAMYTYRERARKLHPRITQPEVVAPVTIHPAFDKAAMLFGLQVRKAPVDDDRRAMPREMEALINENTILVVASAPSYPNGVMDPIEAIAGIAKKHDLPMHVDACIGGFMLPWVEKLGYPIPPWDYRLDGVCSISADVHKFGFGPKGTSVITYKSMDYLRHQFVVTTDYPGGIYISPTLLGTRAGGPIAAAWAGMKHLGQEGYLAVARQLMEGTEHLHQSLSNMPGIKVIGDPCMNLISYTTVDNDPDIFVIADQLEEKGWMVERQQFPDSIHLTVLPTNVTVIDEYLSDLQAAYVYAADHPEAVAKGSAAIYGLMARIPFRGMVEHSVKKIMEDLYGPEDKTGAAQNDPTLDHPAWMGVVNRLFSTWTRLKKTFKNLAHATKMWLIFIVLLGFGASLWAQPYVDPIQVRYQTAFKNGPATPFNHIWMGGDLPFELKKNTYILFSPSFEEWQLDQKDPEYTYPRLQSLVLPVGFILPFNESKWSVTAMLINRWNGNAFFVDNTHQIGGATYVSYQRKEDQKFSLGVYVNNEFFGLFVMPLFGIDWQIDDNNYLFGLLPGRLSYEHKFNKTWYGGFTFRAPTNSFRAPNSGSRYIRLDDNQLSLFVDYYLLENICLTLEPGVGIFRKIRTGVEERTYLTNVNWGDGLFFRVSMAYRIRL
ncbi:aminotransferase class V-fold PLP-dependent enzyme [Flavilitoribacter nigricans]|uniref:DUF6268 domain-containing protein n=1 Tax=Flavilitoribacter nigricans (strain ATCC 23147 / DSM 23189 / NBRC 102662 / NCIMB 1420 / SS-2) TaxID=1122177 RepID=A0A2D0N5N4_FLAN2|nr:aminotransferase class V-fold PLP-dependent enzyme [Flavilitoribacter nigricans]PHN03696.1 hypothetical protein CRP01_25955 [Flavilitoribacter nigricans DSM 23189 = NBRC 102662]